MTETTEKSKVPDFRGIQREFQNKYGDLKKRLWSGEDLREVSNELIENISEPGMPLRADLISASTFAIKKFDGEMRQDQRTPLVLHSLFLPFILKTFGEKRPEAFLVATLHDTIEDTATTLGELKALRFSSTNADIPRLIEFITQDKTVSDALPEGSAISARVKKFMEGLVGAPASIIDVELADRTHDFLDLEYMKLLAPDIAQSRFVNKKERNRNIVSLITKDRNDLNENLLKFFWFLYENAAY